MPDTEMPDPSVLPCSGATDLFYGPDVDGREDDTRAEREAKAKVVCSDCNYRIPCLERALVLRQKYGVWGGMGEGERKAFLAHLRDEGYDDGEVPEGTEFVAAIRSYYRNYIEKKMAQ